MTEPQSQRPSAPRRRRDDLLERVVGVLACPDCKEPLSLGELPPEDSAIPCPGCEFVMRTHGGQIRAGGLGAREVGEDWLNRIKELAKRRLGPLYPFMIRLLSPVYGHDEAPRYLATFDLDRELVIDLGSGTEGHGGRVVCADGSTYPNVHLVCDLESLPLRDGSVSGLLSIAVLEHVPNPSAHVREMFRVLRPGGRVLCYFPFIAAFHASPRDYQRLTLQGLRQLFEDFEVVRTSVGGGPTSGMLWVLQEWLALTLSFGYYIEACKPASAVADHADGPEPVASGRAVERTDRGQT